MDADLRAQVESVANGVRDWAENHVNDESHDLNGWCARASAHMFRKLRKVGIKAEIHAWESDKGFAHVFLVVDDHVVDVTATQFSPFRNRHVLILHHREAQAHEFYRTVHTFHSDKDLRKWQKESGWPQHQIAFAT